MFSIKFLLELKAYDEKTGGWVIDTKKMKLQAIEWNTCDKKYRIIYRHKINPRWKIYNTNTTSDMKYLAISRARLMKYRETKTSGLSTHNV